MRGVLCVDIPEFPEQWGLSILFHQVYTNKY
jgi:hypothetical protein